MNCGWDLSRFVNTPPSSLEQLKCARCLGVIRDAMQLSCGHSFCSHCVNGLSGTCPLDKAGISGAASANCSLRGLINTIPIRCQFKDHCDHVGTVGDIEQHEQQCAQRLLSCSKCELDVAIREFASHNCIEALKSSLDEERNLSDYRQDQCEQVQSELKEVNSQLEKQRQETCHVRNECNKQLASNQAEIVKLKRELDAANANCRLLEQRLQVCERSTGYNSRIGQIKQESGELKHKKKTLAVKIETPTRTDGCDTLEEVDCQHRLNQSNEQYDACIVYKVKSLRNLHEKGVLRCQRLSIPILVRGLQWRVNVQLRFDTEPHSFGIFLQCSLKENSPGWTCTATGEIRLVSQNSPSESVSKRFEHTFCTNYNDYGWIPFIPWKEFVDERCGFMKNGSITVETKFQVGPIGGICWNPRKSPTFPEWKSPATISCVPKCPPPPPIKPRTEKPLEKVPIQQRTPPETRVSFNKELAQRLAVQRAKVEVTK